MVEQKEVTPIAPQTQKQVIKKVDYEDASKKPLIETIKGTAPRQLFPTKRFPKILGAIFVLVLIISGLQFPFSSIISGNMDVTINIGYPLSFLELAIQDKGSSPFLPINLLLDLIIYAILAYIIDISLKLILNTRLFKSKEKIKGSPTIFKNQKQITPEKTQKAPIIS